MKRWFNRDIALGFVLGIVVFLFIAGSLSYQLEHCDKINRAGDTSSRPEQQPQAASLACGAIGIIPSAIGYIDHNEGFFVSVFTLGLFISTALLWKTTIGLWEAGERQIKIADRSAKVAERALTELERPWVFLQGASIRSRIKIPGAPIIPNNFFVKLHFRNIGRAPALTERCLFRFGRKVDLPEGPVYIQQSGLTLPSSISVNETVETNEVGPSPGSEDILVLYGKLIYTELNGEVRETGFAIEISPHMPAFSRYPGEKYTFYT